MADDATDGDTTTGTDGVTTDTSTAATLFDLRTVIAVLFGTFGIILLLVAFFDTTQAELDKAGGLAINLWTGISMLVLSVVFFLWVKTRPPLAAAAEERDTTKPDD